MFEVNAPMTLLLFMMEVEKIMFSQLQSIWCLVTPKASKTFWSMWLGFYVDHRSCCISLCQKCHSQMSDP